MENLPIEDIKSKIYEIRGQKVMLDSDFGEPISSRVKKIK